MRGAAELRMAHTVLTSIDPEQLTAVTGGGLSLGDRDAPPENPNSWAKPLERAAIANSNGYPGTIDRGMSIMPENPKMDPGIWAGMGEGIGESKPLDI
jgi:hypothetical protein